MSVKIDKGQAAGLINLTPMIDVVFQLLLFFIVCSRFADQEREMKVILPQASEATPITKKPVEFVVNVDRDGHFLLGSREVEAAELEHSLRQAAVNNPNHQTVIIRADKRCPWEFVATVINLCYKAKIREHRVVMANETKS